MVFQDHKLLHDRPVADNVALPLIVSGVPRREIDKRMRAALDQVGLSARRRAARSSSRPASSSASASRAPSSPSRTLLIADEPTGNLDPDLALEIMQLFKRFNDVGVTVVIATHDVHLIERFGARRIVLGDGRVVGSAPRDAGAAPHWRRADADARSNLARPACPDPDGSLGRMVRHPVATAMTMAVIAVALALPLFLNVLLQNTRAATGRLEPGVRASVYLDKKAGAERAEALAKQLRARARCRRGAGDHGRSGACGVSRAPRVSARRSMR